ncbi:helix-turn-helix domain-containing protein [Halomonas sp. HAL1]|uniref:helix-turn-helix domain-containing protein n=2 Tax=Halomonas sp. HAL1 TaxID=550984 RepID=UPI0026E06D31|nr:helix-turn-helix domain-containing protein [Halomonas sp. HAL1]WKV93670.1 helix-turn-helix domain-containing protein [Halomonas sp. HAL1]
MTHCYRHLSAEDRAAIMLMRANHSIRAIARQLGRSPSTISRELVRHTVSKRAIKLAITHKSMMHLDWQLGIQQRDLLSG